MQPDEWPWPEQAEPIEPAEDHIPDRDADQMADRETDNYCRTFLGWDEENW